MTSAQTDRERLLVLESQYADLLKDLAQAEIENTRLRSENMTLISVKDQPANKSVLSHMIDVVKMMASIIIILLTGKVMGKI